MDTNSKQFQDALQNLTTAFFQFLDVVNPGGTDREANVRYIAQSLQALAANMGVLSATPASPTQAIEREPIQPASEVIASTTAEPIKTPSAQPVVSQTSHYPQQPNMSREQPSRVAEGVWGFKRLNEYDDKQDFRFYIEGEDGQFDMRPISEPADWAKVYNSRNEIMPSEVVIIEGELTPSARLETIERGIVHSEGARMRQYWHVVKPCRVRVTPT